jgi:hypothetical protein
MEKVIKKLIKELEKEVKQLGKNNWEYHSRIFEEADISKDEVLNDSFDVGGYPDWEDVAFIQGEIYGIEKAISMLEELVKDNN